MGLLPSKIDKVIVPPIKCQGIKTKLIPFISSSLKWDGKGRWIEPFLGSGVVAFNIAPNSALLSDTNKHIINFYNRVKSGSIDHLVVRSALEEMGNKLSKGGADYYYDVREKFNSREDSIKFLFLNRSCFNGLMRFNSKGKFNVPFGQKPNRFSKSYITKISNQVKNVSEIIKERDWDFRLADWRETLSTAKSGDFVYMDPPYIGRNTDYFNGWSLEDAIELSSNSQKLPCQFALSMWLENKYRRNSHIDEHWTKTVVKTFDHFYHVGSTESLRNQVTEALVISSSKSRTTIAA